MNTPTPNLKRSFAVQEIKKFEKFAVQKIKKYKDFALKKIKIFKNICSSKSKDIIGSAKNKEI